MKIRVTGGGKLMKRQGFQAGGGTGRKDSPARYDQSSSI
jgi:hypothetical protein